MSSAAPSGLVVRVDAAEARVGGLRQRFDPQAALGVPAHITVLFPFVAPAAITPALLQGIDAALEGIERFGFVLDCIERFPNTLYLAPHPAQPFVAITEALFRAFPAHAPFGGVHAEVVPHLTVATGSAAELDRAEAELAAEWHKHGPVHATCTSISLLENSSGLWKETHVFELS